ncbi:PLP-dependent aminotransferase family protein [Streptacidiphilus monticola]|uniref:PLP-dependent aminotransferase family protein n=1 Tax=Streptacidiphilus monticola TaxID=2161674 RepID=A0ABW1FW46_9ACTN
MLLTVTGTGPRSRARALAAALRAAVRDGTLPAGTRLPPSRELAADLRLSRGVVTEVYGQLLAEGYLTARQGAGTWVAELPGAVTVPPPAPPPRPHSGPPPTDFRPGLPDLSLFPRAAWSAAQRQALAQLPDAALDYPDPRGLPRLREELARLLARRRGVAVHPDGIVVCAGVSQALTLLARVLHARGHRRIAVEDPGSPPQAPLFAAAGLKTVGVPVDGEGVDVAALRATGVRAVVVTPAHQFPHGVVLSAARRSELLDWARSCGGLVVEDDYDGEFRYDRAPVGALQGLAPDQVAYTGSVSKLLAPALRLGWVVPPPALLEELVEAKRTADLGTSVPDQAALAAFAAGGRLDRQLRLCQRAYRARRDVLVAELTAAFPGLRVSGIAAGLHVIAEFPAAAGPRARLERAAAEAGVRLRHLDEYAISKGAPSLRLRYVLGYAHLREPVLRAGVRALAARL